MQSHTAGTLDYWHLRSGMSNSTVCSKPLRKHEGCRSGVCFLLSVALLYHHRESSGIFSDQPLSSLCWTIVFDSCFLTEFRIFYILLPVLRGVELPSFMAPHHFLLDSAFLGSFYPHMAIYHSFIWQCQ